METTFDCVCCGDDFTSVPIQIQGSNVCVECFTTGILPQFEEALEDETKYPVQWGGHELNIQDYRDYVPLDLLTRWNERLQEYQTDVQDRLYCCGNNALKSCIKRAASVPAKTVSFAQPLSDSTQPPGQQDSSRPLEKCSAFLGSKHQIREALAAPTVLILANLPPHTGKLTGLEPAAQAFGRITEYRLLRADPTFVAELTFVDNIAAQQFLAKYHKWPAGANGRVLDISIADQHIAHLKGRIVECTRCASEICSKCSKVLVKQECHDCELDAEDDPFRGLIRGRDYQQCPKSSCQIKIALRDGCNHMRCSFCRTSFCFICGQEVSQSSPKA